MRKFHGHKVEGEPFSMTKKPLRPWRETLAGIFLCLVHFRAWTWNATHGYTITYGLAYEDRNQGEWVEMHEDSWTHSVHYGGCWEYPISTFYLRLRAWPPKILDRVVDVFDHVDCPPDRWLVKAR